MTRREPAVAIDGPAGAGKSTVSRAVARRLGYLLLDTGALYRCVALAAQTKRVSWDDESGVAAVAQALADSNAIRFESGTDGTQRVFLGPEDVTTAIRTQALGDGASRVSALGAVRAALLDLQRRAAAQGGVVLEGRDIGTVVLPDAEAKFFLTASVDVRAERRRAELESRGLRASLDDVRREVVERDERDSTRAVAPLRQAPDALLVDSSHLSPAEVVEVIVRRVEAIRQGHA